MLIGSAIGVPVGAGMGALAADEDNRGVGAVVGAGLGAAAGGLGGNIYHSGNPMPSLSPNLKTKVFLHRQEPKSRPGFAVKKIDMGLTPVYVEIPQHHADPAYHIDNPEDLNETVKRILDVRPTPGQKGTPMNLKLRLDKLVLGEPRGGRSEGVEELKRQARVAAKAGGVKKADEALDPGRLAAVVARAKGIRDAMLPYGLSPAALGAGVGLASGALSGPESKDEFGQPIPKTLSDRLRHALIGGAMGTAIGGAGAYGASRGIRGLRALSPVLGTGAL